jgi:hypothetical protein
MVEQWNDARLRPRRSRPQHSRVPLFQHAAAGAATMKHGALILLLGLGLLAAAVSAAAGPLRVERGLPLQRGWDARDAITTP